MEKRSDRTYQIILRFDKNSESDMQVYEMLQKRDKRKYPRYADFFCDAVLGRHIQESAERPATCQDIRELLEEYLGRNNSVNIPGR